MLPILTPAAPALAADGEKSACSFRMTIVSRVKGNAGGKAIAIDADTTLRYTLERDGREVALIFDEVATRAARDGQVLMDVTMSRARLKEVHDGEVAEVSAADPPQQLKKILEDSFGVPVCKIAVDEDGKETNRTAVAGPGAKGLFDNGQIANARLFHPAFPSARGKWQEDREVSMGNGNMVRGKLAYEKLTAKGDLVPVKVSGNLDNTQAKLPDPQLSVLTKYEVSGQQVYNTARREWVAGDLLFKVSMRMEKEGKAVGSSEGTLRVKLESTPAK